MMLPPSLPDEVRARAFQASNGELGIVLGDAPAFLAACRADEVEVLGWELWIVDHLWGPDNSPVPAPGSWCGGVPMVGYEVPAVVGGEGGVNEAERQLSSHDFAAEVLPAWLPYARVNFCLDD